MTRSPTLGRTVGALAAAATATALVRRHRTLRAVSPDLRTPDL